MRIGFFSPYLDTFGGGEKYMLTLASALSDKNEVDVFWEKSDIKASLARFLKIDLSKVRFVDNIFAKGTLEKLWKTIGYDMIFFLSDGSIPLTLAPKNILHFQVPFTNKKLDLKDKLELKRFKWIVSNSYFTKSFIDDTYQVNSLVIYPPIDMKNIKRVKKEKIIMSVGRFSAKQLHTKKQEVLIEVFKKLYKHKPEWKLFLVGQTKKEDQSYVRTLKKSTRGFGIKIFENLPVDRLRDLYSKSSIYWHATGFGIDEKKFPEKMEHFGISTVEAQAAGVVPVVIAKGGQKETVKDGENGFLWQTKLQLFELTNSLIDNSKLWQKLSAAAVKNSRRFSQDNFVKAYEKILFE